jgi:hypothetical protein
VRQLAAGSGVPGRPAGGEVRVTIRFEFGRRAEAMVGVPGGDQLVRVRRIQVEPLGLSIRAVRAADVGALVPVEPEPPQVFEDARFRVARRSDRVGILDAQNERAVLAVRQEPVEQRRPGIAHV